jgi:hypothetical protein
MIAVVGYVSMQFQSVRLIGSMNTALGGQLKTDNFWTGKTDNF